MMLQRGITPKGTFGQLTTDDGLHLCYTLEQIWLDNTPFKSCVPNGHYQLIPYASSRFGQTVCLKNTMLGVSLYPGEAKRYACLFHAANQVHQLHGCIAPVSRFGPRWNGYTSRAALTRVLDHIHQEQDYQVLIQSHTTEPVFY